MAPLRITSNVFTHVTQFEQCSQSTGYVHLQPWSLIVQLSRSNCGRDVNQNTLHCRNVRTNNPTTTIPGLGCNQWHIYGGVLVGTRGLLDMQVGLTHGHQSGSHPHVPLVIVNLSVSTWQLLVCLTALHSHGRSALPWHTKHLNTVPQS
jgi:hypothetical protein